MKKESLQEMVSIFEPSVDDGPCIFIFTEEVKLTAIQPNLLTSVIQMTPYPFLFYISLMKRPFSGVCK